MFKKITGSILISTFSLYGLYAVNSNNINVDKPSILNIFATESAYAEPKNAEKKLDIEIPKIENTKDPDDADSKKRELNQEIYENKPANQKESIEDLKKSDVSKNVTSVGKNIENDNADKDINDFYFVGLKSFDEKLYDIASLSLKKYLSYDNTSKKAVYATYILYQSLIMEKKYTESLDYIEKLNTYKDKRIDRSKVRTDFMKIEVGLGCDKAKSALINSPNQEYITVYLKSTCKIDKDIKNLIAKNKLSADNLNHLLPRVQDDVDFNVLIYNNLNPEYKVPAIQNYFATYFYGNNKIDMFEKIYAVYKDNDLVVLKLDDLYNKKESQKYIDLFKESINKKYKLPAVTYCRMIDTSSKLNKEFNCNYADKCFDKDTFNRNKTKFACFLKNQNAEGAKGIMKEISAKDAVKLCDYGRYAISKKYYTRSTVGKFSGCKDVEKASMFESLYEFKDYDGMLNLVGNNSSEMNIAYAAMAHNKLGHIKTYNSLMEKLKNQKLIKMVRSRVE